MIQAQPHAARLKASSKPYISTTLVRAPEIEPLNTCLLEAIADAWSARGCGILFTSAARKGRPRSRSRSKRRCSIENEIPSNQLPRRREFREEERWRLAVALDRESIVAHAVFLASRIEGTAKPFNERNGKNVNEVCKAVPGSIVLHRSHSFWAMFLKWAFSRMKFRDGY